MQEANHDQGLVRWRMVLGKQADPSKDIELSGEDMARDQALGALYDSTKKGDLSASNPNVNKWLGDIRKYFPESAAILLQKEAVNRVGIVRFLENPEVLESVVPDIQLAQTILSLKEAIPDQAKSTARAVIARMAAQLQHKLKLPVHQAARKGIYRFQRENYKHNKMLDWPRTIRHNLKNYNPESGQIIPEKIFGFNSRKHALREIYILMDQSGSMASSLVYTGIIASLLHQLPALVTHLYLFDTQVVDMTDLLHDPVELLFGVQLGGGTDIRKTLAFTRQQMRRPKDAIVFLISDLYDSAPDRHLIDSILLLHEEGVKIMVIPSLSDDGKADFNRAVAESISEKGILTIACTPDKFCEVLPDILA
jgi:hypothetical protein